MNSQFVPKKNLCWVLFTLLLFPASAQQPDKEISKVNFADTIPFEFVRNKMLVSSFVDGRPVKLIFDTGVTSMMINRSLLDGSGTTLYTDSVRDANGVKKPLSYTYLKELRLGDIRFRNYKAGCWDMGQNNPFACEGADGLIGGDILQTLSVKIDVMNKRLILTDRRKHFAADKGKWNSMKVMNNIPVIAVQPFRKVHESAVMFDTGSDGFYEMCDDIYKQLMDRMPQYISPLIVDKGSGKSKMGLLGSGTDVLRYRLQSDECKINGVKFTNVFTETHTGSISRIGADLLNYGLVIVDYPRQQFLFSPYEKVSAIELPVENVTFPLVFEEGRIKIGLVWEHSEAWRLGLRKGFVLLQINGEELENDLCALLRFKGIAKKSVKVIDLEGKEREFVFDTIGK